MFQCMQGLVHIDLVCSGRRHSYDCLQSTSVILIGGTFNKS